MRIISLISFILLIACCNNTNNGVLDVICTTKDIDSVDTKYCKQYFSKEELLGRLERNAKEMNDSLRSDYVVLMLSVADSSFMKTDDFVVFLNYLQGKCTEEYSEGIGYNLMNIYLNNRDKINRVEEYIAMMPAESQRVLYKGLCDKLFCEYAIEKTFNDTIDTRELYKIVPILGKHHSLTEEIAKECDIVLVNRLQ